MATLKDILIAAQGTKKSSIPDNVKKIVIKEQKVIKEGISNNIPLQTIADGLTTIYAKELGKQKRKVPVAVSKEERAMGITKSGKTVVRETQIKITPKRIEKILGRLEIR